MLSADSSCYLQIKEEELTLVALMSVFTWTVSVKSTLVVFTLYVVSKECHLS